MKTVITSVSLVFLLTSSIAFACKRVADYKFPTIAQSFASATLVFEGEIVRNGPSNKPRNSRIFWSTKGFFRIVRVWKGDLTKGDNIEIYLEQSDCDPLGQMTEPGAHFVIFARPFIESLNVDDAHSVWRSGFDYGSFELSSFRFPNNKDKDIAQIKVLDDIEKQKITQPGAQPDAGTGRKLTP